MEDLIQNRNSMRERSSQRPVDDDAAINCQGTMISNRSNGISDVGNRYLRASEILSDSLASREAIDAHENAFQVSHEEYSYENTRGIYLEVEDGLSTTARDCDNTRNIKLFKNQSYATNTPQQLSSLDSIRLVANQSYGTGDQEEQSSKSSEFPPDQMCKD